MVNCSQKWLITGARGWIGSHLASEARANGHLIQLTSRTESGPGCFATGPISEHTVWTRALDGCESVIHLAASTKCPAGRDAQEIYDRTNVGATLTLARQAAASGVKRFVFLSSIKVNGESTPEGSAFGPYDVPCPEDAYAKSKQRAEDELLRLGKQVPMQVVVIRPPLVYGPGVKGNFASLSRLVQRSIPLPFGSVCNRRAMIGIENLTNFIALCADRQRSPHAAGRIFTISDGHDFSIGEIISKIAAAYRVRAALFPCPPAFLYGISKMLGLSKQMQRLITSLAVDDSQAREVLGWRPVLTMDEQLNIMAAREFFGTA